MKRLICAILCGILVLGAVACSTPNPNYVAKNARAFTDEPTEDATATPTAEHQKNLEKDKTTKEPMTTPTPKTTEQTGQTEERDVNAYNTYAYALAAQLLTGDTNENCSPYSLYFALAMLCEGAQGQTRQELLTLLGVPDLDTLRQNCAGMLADFTYDTQYSVLDTHNSLWLAKRFDGTFHDTFTENLAERYHAAAASVDFGGSEASQKIADWIAKYTRGAIAPAPGTLQFSANTVMALVNTIYLKDAWDNEFNPQNTASDTFTKADGSTVQVDFMQRGFSDYAATVGDGYVRLTVNLAAVGSMTFVLPDEGFDLSAMLAGDGAIEHLLCDGIDGRYDVTFKLPKFSFDARYDLPAVLQRMGVTTAFGDGADFSGISDIPSAVDTVVQETHIAVDENGVEAAAYTMISNRATSVMPVERPALSVILNRPFLFAIEARDGSTLFIGVVRDPS